MLSARAAASSKPLRRRPWWCTARKLTIFVAALAVAVSPMGVYGFGLLAASEGASPCAVSGSILALVLAFYLAATIAALQMWRSAYTSFHQRLHVRAAERQAQLSIAFEQAWAAVLAEADTVDDINRSASTWGPRSMIAKTLAHFVLPCILVCHAAHTYPCAGKALGIAELCINLAASLLLLSIFAAANAAVYAKVITPARAG